MSPEPPVDEQKSPEEIEHRILEILQKENHFFRAIAENSPAVIYSKSPDGRHTYVNQEFARLFETTPDRLLGRTDHEIMAPPKAARLRADELEVMETGAPIRFDDVVLVAGKERIYSTLKFPLRDQAGRITGVAGISIEITEQKQAELELREAGELARALNHLQTLLHSSHDFDEIMARVAVEAARAMGVEGFGVGLLDGERFVLQYGNKLPPGIQDRIFSLSDLKGVRLALSGNAPLAAENALEDERLNTEITRQFGIRSILIAPLRVRGEALGTLNFCRVSESSPFSPLQIDFARKLANSISLSFDNARLHAELQKTGERLRFSLEAADLGAWDLDLATHQVWRSGKHDEIFGYDSPLPEWTYETFLEHVIPEERPEVEQKFRQMLESRQKWNVQCRIRRRDGEIRWKWGQGALMFDEKGEPRRLLGVTRDITSQRKLEEDVQRIQKLESIGSLAGGIAHDFNNLLTSIIGNLELARMYRKDPEMVHARLVQAEKASGRAKRLARQLLTFARGGAPIIKLASARELIMDTVEFSLAGSKVKVGFRITPDLWLAKLDEEQISQVLRNLVRNAEEAMPEGGFLEVTADNEEIQPDPELPLPAGKYLRISITDQGPGIPESDLHRIFDPYFTTKEGTGLGLAVCHSIVQRHQGHIAARSCPGGATFTFWLPASGQGASHSLSPMQSRQPGEGRVLVLEDNQAVQEALGPMLTALGYQPVFTADGRKALTLFCKARETGAPFTAVILDLTIPGGMGGEQTIRKMREFDPQVRALATSGYANDPIMAHHREYGFAGIIPKPFKLEELRKTLAAAIRGSS